MNVCIQVFSEFNLKYCDNDISHVYVQTMDVYRYMNLFSVHSYVYIDTYIYICMYFWTHSALRYETKWIHVAHFCRCRVKLNSPFFFASGVGF